MKLRTLQTFLMKKDTTNLCIWCSCLMWSRVEPDEMSQDVTFLLSSTNDHHTKEATDSDHATSPHDNAITKWCQTTPTTAKTTTPRADKRTQCPPQPPPTTTAHHPKWGRMPRNHTNRQPSRATGDNRPPKTLTTTYHHHARSTTATTTRKVRVSFTASSHELKTPKRPQNDRLQPRKAHNDDGHPKTLTTTPPSPRSIDNGHHHPQGTSVAHHQRLRTANTQTTTDRPPTTQESPLATRSTHPSQPRTTTDVRKRR